MTQLKNGTLIVVIATIVTAVLILMTGREATVAVAEKHEAVVESETVQAETIETETNNVEQQIQAVVAVATEQATDAVTEVEQVSASDVLAKTDEVQQAHTLTSTAPEGPYNKTVVDTDQEADAETNTILENVAATSTQHDVLNHIIQPIWMDQKLGDFKSLDQDGVVFRMLPRSSDGLQGENPAQVITSKSDKFAPTTISANYNYQQMPMYNGGYYIAPMPSYLMPSMLPGTVDINIKKQK